MLSLWVALLGCADDDGETGGATTPPGDPCLQGPNPTLVIGTGDLAYAPMPDEVELVHGPQGGYHVLVAYEATYLDSSAVVGGVVTGTIGGEEVASTAPWMELRCNPDTQTLQAWGTLLIYSNGGPSDPTPADLNGQPTTIAATLTDSAGGIATGSVDTTVVDPLVE